MDQDLVTSEIQALLATLKASLSENLASGGGTLCEPVGAAENQQHDRLSGDRLPDVRALRRFLLMV